jgi:hypothetical protein
MAEDRGQDTVKPSIDDLIEPIDDTTIDPVDDNTVPAFPDNNLLYLIGGGYQQCLMLMSDVNDRSQNPINRDELATLCRDMIRIHREAVRPEIDREDDLEADS